MRHLVVLALVLVLSGLVVAATIGLGSVAARERDRVTAVFWPGTGSQAIMAAVTRAEGRLIRATPVPFAVEVAGDTPGIAERLAAAGTLFVLAELPAHLLAVGGCSYLSPAAYAGATAARGAIQTWVRPL
jgi:hypothetical protein